MSCVSDWRHTIPLHINTILPFRNITRPQLTWKESRYSYWNIQILIRDKTYTISIVIWEKILQWGCNTKFGHSNRFFRSICDLRKPQKYLTTFLSHEQCGYTLMKDRCSVYEIDVITRPNVLSIAMNISKLKLLWGFCIMGAKSKRLI